MSRPASLHLLAILALLPACATVRPVTAPPAAPAAPRVVEAAPPGPSPGCLPGEAGDPAAVEQACARELAVADDPERRLRRALALEQLGRDAEAIVELERLRVADPSLMAARARLAERYEAVGRLTEAETELREMARERADRPEGWRRLAAFCARHGFTESATGAEARAREAEARPRRELRPLLPTGR